jgi:hypothetical protein
MEYEFVFEINPTYDLNLLVRVNYDFYVENYGEDADGNRGIETACININAMRIFLFSSPLIEITQFIEKKLPQLYEAIKDQFHTELDGEVMQ